MKINFQVTAKHESIYEPNVYILPYHLLHPSAPHHLSLNQLLNFDALQQLQNKVTKINSRNHQIHVSIK